MGKERQQHRNKLQGVERLALAGYEHEQSRAIWAIQLLNQEPRAISFSNGRLDTFSCNNLYSI
jgi:hypothetical protein